MSVFLLIITQRFHPLEYVVFHHGTCHPELSLNSGLNVTSTLEERLNGILTQVLSVWGSTGIFQWLTK